MADICISTMWTPRMSRRILNSSLFYNYFIAFGDCFHLSDGLVSAFPVSPAFFSDESLSRLGRELMADLGANSERKQIKTKKGGDDIRYAEFYG